MHEMAFILQPRQICRKADFPGKLHFFADGVAVAFDAAEGDGEKVGDLLVRKVHFPSEVLEIDPLVTCPVCGAPTAEQRGRFGAFFGCVRFPACRGRRTLAEAARLRASAR